MRTFIILWVSLAALFLSGCSTTGQPHAGIGPAVGGEQHGGGVAYMRNGEKLIFDEQGGISTRCQLCQSLEEGLGACKTIAAGKGIAVCPELLDAAVPRGAMMCEVVYGPHAGTTVPFGTPGYYCYMVSSTRCSCFG